MKRTRGPYKQYTVNGIPRRTEYRQRQRLLIEVNEQIQADREAGDLAIPEPSELRRDLQQDKVCVYFY